MPLQGKQYQYIYIYIILTPQKRAIFIHFRCKVTKVREHFLKFIVKEGHSDVVRNIIF